MAWERLSDCQAHYLIRNSPRYLAPHQASLSGLKLHTYAPRPIFSPVVPGWARASSKEQLATSTITTRGPSPLACTIATTIATPLSSHLDGSFFLLSLTPLVTFARLKCPLQSCWTRAYRTPNSGTADRATTHLQRPPTWRASRHPTHIWARSPSRNDPSRGPSRAHLRRMAANTRSHSNRRSKATLPRECGTMISSTSPARTGGCWLF
jgi:hypothetical protein